MTAHWWDHLMYRKMDKASIPLAWHSCVPKLCSVLRLWRNGVNYRPYTWYWCMEHENRKEYKQEWEELAVTIDNACTIHYANQSHVLCCSDLPYFPVVCVCMSSMTGTTWRKLEPPDSSCRYCIAAHGHGIALFVYTLANSHTPHTVGKLTVYSLMSFSLSP